MFQNTFFFVYLQHQTSKNTFEPQKHELGGKILASPFGESNASALFVWSEDRLPKLQFTQATDLLTNTSTPSRKNCILSSLDHLVEGNFKLFDARKHWLPDRTSELSLGIDLQLLDLKSEWVIYLVFFVPHTLSACAVLGKF